MLTFLLIILMGIVWGFVYNFSKNNTPTVDDEIKQSIIFVICLPLLIGESLWIEYEQWLNKT